MTLGTRVGRSVGVLVVLHLAAGLIVPFVLVLPPVQPRSFLVNAVEIPIQVRTLSCCYLWAAAERGHGPHSPAVGTSNTEPWRSRIVRRTLPRNAF